MPDDHFTVSGFRAIDDVDGDNIPDLVVSALTQWDGSDSTYNAVALFETTKRQAATTVEREASDQARHGCPKARAVQDGWVVNTISPESAVAVEEGSAMIYDVRGRVIGSVSLTHSGTEIMANPQGHLGPGAYWLLLDDCLVRLP